MGKTRNPDFQYWRAYKSLTESGQIGWQRAFATAHSLNCLFLRGYRGSKWRVHPDILYQLANWFDTQMDCYDESPPGQDNSIEHGMAVDDATFLPDKTVPLAIWPGIPGVRRVGG